MANEIDSGRYIFDTQVPIPEDLSLNRRFREIADKVGIINPTEAFEDFKRQAHEKGWAYRDWSNAWGKWLLEQKTHATIGERRLFLPPDSHQESSPMPPKTDQALHGEARMSSLPFLSEKEATPPLPVEHHEPSPRIIEDPEDIFKLDVIPEGKIPVPEDHSAPPARTPLDKEFRMRMEGASFLGSDAPVPPATAPPPAGGNEVPAPAPSESPTKERPRRKRNTMLKDVSKPQTPESGIAEPAVPENPTVPEKTNPWEKRFEEAERKKRLRVALETLSAKFFNYPEKSTVVRPYPEGITETHERFVRSLDKTEFRRMSEEERRFVAYFVLKFYRFSDEESERIIKEYRLPSLEDPKVDVPIDDDEEITPPDPPVMPRKLGMVEIVVILMIMLQSATTFAVFRLLYWESTRPVAEIHLSSPSGQSDPDVKHPTPSSTLDDHGN